jgi:hypothetical protein
MQPDPYDLEEFCVYHLRNLSLLAMSVVVLGLLGVMPEAEARGGGSSFMNSPGYQRRLQESRGYVTNQSGALFAPPAASAPPRVYVKPKPRRRR